MNKDWKKIINESPLLDKEFYHTLIDNNDFDRIKTEKNKILSAYGYYITPFMENYGEKYSAFSLYIIKYIDDLLEKYDSSYDATFLTYIEMRAKTNSTYKKEQSAESSVIKIPYNLKCAILSYANLKKKKITELNDEDIQILCAMKEKLSVDNCKSAINLMAGEKSLDKEKKVDDSSSTLYDITEDTNSYSEMIELDDEPELHEKLQKIEKYYLKDMTPQGRKNFPRYFTITILSDKNFSFDRVNKHFAQYSFWDKEIATKENFALSKLDLLKKYRLHESKRSKIMNAIRID